MEELNHNCIEQAPIPKKLTWDDLTFLGKQSWGLRHVSSLDNAKNELKEGFTGDAVSLSGSNRLIPVETINRFNLTDSLIDTLSFPVLATFTPETDRQKIVSNYERSVKNFIGDSIGMDIISITNETTTAKLLNLLTSTKSGFIIAVFQSANWPRDLENYHDLGKCGKQHVGSEKIVTEIDLSDSEKVVTDGLDLTTFQSSTALTKESYSEIKKSCTDIIWNKLLKIIKEKNKERHLLRLIWLRNGPKPRCSALPHGFLRT